MNLVLPPCSSKGEKLKKATSYKAYVSLKNFFGYLFVCKNVMLSLKFAESKGSYAAMLIQDQRVLDQANY